MGGKLGTNIKLLIVKRVNQQNMALAVRPSFEPPFAAAFWFSNVQTSIKDGNGGWLPFPSLPPTLSLSLPNNTKGSLESPCCPILYLFIIMFSSGPHICNFYLYLANWLATSFTSALATSSASGLPSCSASAFAMLRSLGSGTSTSYLVPGNFRPSSFWSRWSWLGTCTCTCLLLYSRPFTCPYVMPHAQFTLLAFSLSPFFLLYASLPGGP